MPKEVLANPARKATQARADIRDEDLARSAPRYEVWLDKCVAIGPRPPLINFARRLAQAVAGKAGAAKAGAGAPLRDFHLRVAVHILHGHRKATRRQLTELVLLVNGGMTALVLLAIGKRI